MPDAIKMDFGGVTSVATALSGQAQQNLDDLTRLAARAAPADVWNGASATAYQTAFDRFQSAEKNLQEALTELSRQVTVIKDNFQQIDQGGEAAFNRFLG